MTNENDEAQGEDIVEDAITVGKTEDETKIAMMECRKKSAGTGGGKPGFITKLYELLKSNTACAEGDGDHDDASNHGLLLHRPYCWLLQSFYRWR